MAKMARKKIENCFNVDFSMAQYINLWASSFRSKKGVYS